MREQVSRLTKLATDLLDLSRLDAGAVAVERRADRPGRGGARAGARVPRPGRAATAAASCWCVRRAGLPHAIGDEQRVQQIGRALVDNADPPQPARAPRCASAVERRRRHRAAERVADDGPGIDADRSGTCSSASTAAESSSSGSGLGLAIARELAERMGGEIAVSSGEGDTTFALRLPSDGADR